MTLTEELKKEPLHIIQARDVSPGQQFPPELALCDRFRVSRHTMREAIRDLVQEGYLFRPVSKVVKAPYTLEVSFPRKDELTALQIPTSAPVFIVKSRSKDQFKRWVDYRISISRSDMIKFTNLTFEYDNRLM
jgi:DNA-binding GntR family transcriptional regulator